MITVETKEWKCRDDLWSVTDIKLKWRACAEYEPR